MGIMHRPRILLPIGLIFIHVGALKVADNPAPLSDLKTIRRCYKSVQAGDPIHNCDRAFNFWVQRRVYCSTEKSGGDFILSPPGTRRKYVRKFSDGRDDVEATETVEKVALVEGPVVQIWVRRKSMGIDALVSYLYLGKSGDLLLDSMHTAQRVITCHRPETYLPAAVNSSYTWTGQGCWLTDVVSNDVYPHAFRSVFKELFAPGSSVLWRYEVSPVTGPTSVRGGDFGDGIIKNSVLRGDDGGTIEYRETFIRGVGSVMSSHLLRGEEIWREELVEFTYPNPPNDIAAFCRPIRYPSGP